MYLEQFHNLPLSKTNKLITYDKIRILTTYIEICELLEVDPDKLYKVSDIDKPSVEDVKYLISIITIYNNLYDIYGSNPLVKNWLTDKKREYPFNGTDAMSAMQADSNNIMKIRIYTNSFIVYLNEIILGVMPNG